MTSCRSTVLSQEHTSKKVCIVTGLKAYMGNFQNREKKAQDIPEEKINFEVVLGQGHTLGTPW